MPIAEGQPGELFRKILERLQRDLASERLSDAELDYKFSCKLENEKVCVVTIILERRRR